MSLVARLESKFGRYAPANVTLVLIAGQVLCFLADQLGGPNNAGVLEGIQLVPAKVAEGEVWRVVTYLFAPIEAHPIFIIFAWYLFYLMGTTLEAEWGPFRYNVFLLLGYIASLLSALVYYLLIPGFPATAATNGFLYGSVFLAFARMYPDFTLMLMFILPVKIKWLALLTWLGYAGTLLFGDWMSRLMVLAATSNYLLFFGRDIWRDVKQGRRRMSHQARTLRTPTKVVHKCHVCGLSSAESPRAAFRYCSKCEGHYCYCAEHLGNHEHVVKEPAS